MKTAWVRGLAAVAVAVALGMPSRAATFQRDDGVAENVVGLFDDRDLWWANAFNTSAINLNEAIIQTLEVEFVPTAFPPLNSPFTLMLYEDTDDNGNPNDGLVLLQQVNGTVTAHLADLVLDIPDTLVSGGFFVGAFYESGSDHPMGIDTSSTQMSSWFGVGENRDIANPTTYNDFFGSLILVDGPVFPGNWLLRANGIGPSVVPEPASASLGLIGLAALALRRRQA